jgi:hypothetical protein
VAVQVAALDEVGQCELPDNIRAGVVECLLQRQVLQQ